MKKWIIAGLILIMYESILHAQTTPHPPFTLPSPHVGSYKPNGQIQVWPATIYVRDAHNVVKAVPGFVKVKKYAYYAIAGEWKAGEFGNVPPHWKIYAIMDANHVTIPWSVYDHYETTQPDTKKTLIR